MISIPSKERHCFSSPFASTDSASLVVFVPVSTTLTYTRMQEDPDPSSLSDDNGKESFVFLSQVSRAMNE